jgi:hypothetical protein
MASGFFAAVRIVAMCLRERRSNTVTLPSAPFDVKPLPKSGASAMPWTPGVSGMSPTTVPVMGSTTMTWVERETKRRFAAGSYVR